MILEEVLICNMLRESNITKFLYTIRRSLLFYIWIFYKGDIKVCASKSVYLTCTFTLQKYTDLLVHTGIHWYFLDILPHYWENGKLTINQDLTNRQIITSSRNNNKEKLLFIKSVSVFFIMPNWWIGSNCNTKSV